MTVGLPPAPGRPAAPGRSARGSLNIRLSEDERAILATAADASRQSTGEYIRRAALQAADPAGAARASYSACRARSSARAAAHRAGRSFARGG